MLKTYKLLILLSFAIGIGSLSGCNWLNSEDGEDFEEDTTVDAMEAVQLTLAASKYAQWLPWYLAASESLYQQNSDENLQVQFEEGHYEGTINRFISGEVQALVINNIDAIAKFSSEGIDVDVILIGSYSTGSDAVLIPQDQEPDIAGKTVALKQESVGHYLLDRYLLKNQLSFGDVNIVDTPDSALKEVFGTAGIAAVATSNPILEELVLEKKAQPLFSSASIPQEIMHLLVVRRKVLEEHPDFGRALLATWFTIMDRLQGSRRASTLDSMAEIMGMERTRFDTEMAGIQLTDTRNKALSSIRERRRMKKTMRHIRFFMERHSLTGNLDESTWVSYPGRAKALIHFNAKPLQDYIAPAETEEETF